MAAEFDDRARSASPIAALTYNNKRLAAKTRARLAGGRASFFRHTSDAVGDRLTELTEAGTSNCTYDNANRLSGAGGEVSAPFMSIHRARIPADRLSLL